MIQRKHQYRFSPNDLKEWKEIGDKYVGDYHIDDNNRFAIENLIKWYYGEPFMQNIPKDKSTKEGNPNKGVYLVGPPGTGKTLMMKILKDFAKKRPNKFTFEDKEVGCCWKTEHATELTDKFMQGESLIDEKTVNILQIEDLGTEPISSQYMGNKCEVLKSILERRGDFENFTIITTNLPLIDNSINSRYGQRVKSRINSLNYLSLKGDDRRQ